MSGCISNWHTKMADFRPQPITVVISTFNSEKFVGAAVASVRAQTYPNIILIAVDNNSTDSTREVLTDLDVTWYSEKLQGAGAARNHGLMNSDSDLILFLDSDDTLHPNALTLLSSSLVESNAESAYGRIRNVFLNPHDTTQSQRMHDHYLESSQVAMLASSTLFHRDVFTKYGPFDSDNFSFARWVVSARDAGAFFVGVDVEIALRGIHGANISLTEDSTAEFFKIIRGRTQRRRAGDD